MDKQSNVRLHSGRSMPVLGLGTWQLTDDTADVIAYAISLGYRMIDTSSDYGTQPAIAEAVRKSETEREDLYLVTKIEETDDAYRAAQEYVGQMQTAYADLFLIHRPPEDGAGIGLWKGLIKAQQEGIAKDIGVSNYTEAQIQELIDATGYVPSVNQIEWSPFGYSEEMMKFCNSKGIVIQAYSPLTRSERLGDVHLQDIAEKYDKTPAQIIIRWNLQLGTVPLPKANYREHLEENINVFDFEIEEDDMHHLADLNEAYSALGALPYA